MKEEFCIFFDVLGTSAKFKHITIEEEVKVLDKYEKLLEIIRCEAEKIDIPKNKIKYFSDNIFVSVSKNGLKEINELLNFISSCQVKAITECEFVMRGAIVFNTIRNSDKVLMGKGLIEAYNEEEKAKYPWLKFNEKAINQYDELLKRRTEEAMDKINIETRKNFDKDDNYSKIKKSITEELIKSRVDKLRILKIRNSGFLNYLHYIKDEKEIDYILKKHKEFIIKNLKKDLSILTEEELKLIKIKDCMYIRMFWYFAYKMHIEISRENLDFIKNNPRAEKLLWNSDESVISNLEEEIKKGNEIRKELRKQINPLYFKKGMRKKINNIVKIRDKYLFLAFYHNLFIDFIKEKNKEINANKNEYTIHDEEIYKK